MRLKLLCGLPGGSAGSTLVRKGSLANENQDPVLTRGFWLALAAAAKARMGA